MNLLEQITSFLADCDMDDMHRMAAATGVPVHTIMKIRSGETQNPRIKTVEALMLYVKPPRGKRG